MKKIIMSIIVILIIVVGAIFIFGKDDEIEKKEIKTKKNDLESISYYKKEYKERYDNYKKKNKELSNEESTEVKDSDYYPIEKIYDIIHRMSNTKIIAEDNQIWGKIEMDHEYITSLKNLIEKVDYADKDYMLEVLTRWENNDFSNAVEEHNYFWKKLGGTVGKATGLKE